MIQWADNFSNYGDDETNMVDGLWAQVGSALLVNDPDGVSGGKVLQLGGARGARRVLSSELGTVGAAFRIWYPNLPSSNNENSFILFNDNANAVQCSVGCTTTGTVRAWRGDTGTILDDTGPLITAAAWHHVEIRVTIHDTTGAMEVRLNGVPVIELEDIDTKNTSLANCAQIVVGDFTVGSGSFYMKDLVCWDTTGSQNNDFLGDVQVITLRPDGDDTLTFDPSTGSTGFDLIDESTPNDSDYITADDTPPAPSVFTLSDLPPDIVTVKALITVVRAVKTSSGDANLQVSLVSNGMEDSGDDRPITVANTCWFDVSELDPDTAAAWTPEAVNDALLKLDRTI